MRNIIFFGPAGAGKTTAAEMMIREIDKKIVNYRGGRNVGRTMKQVYVFKVPLGSKIKKISKELMYAGGIEQEDRTAYQSVGQEMRRIFGDLVWCAAVEKRIAEIKSKWGRSKNYIFIIDDGRQYNEYDYWTGKGFTAVGITADLETRIERVLKRDGYDQRNNMGFENEISANAVAQEKCKYLIRNDGTLDELREAVRGILRVVEGSGNE